MPTVMTPQGPVQLPYPGDPGGGGGMGGPMGADPMAAMGAPPMGGPPPSPPAGGGSESDRLRQILAELMDLHQNNSDELDSAAYVDAMRMVQKILTTQAKDQDAAMGVSPASRVMRRGA